MMEAHSKRWIPGLLQAISERSGGGLFAIMRRNSAASELSNSKRPETESDGGFGDAPDATRGYDVQEYEKMWHALSKEQTWPSTQRFSIIGPAGEDFLGAVNQTVAETLGPPEKVFVVPKQRWQSVRFDVKCKSPDDFCLLHHRLKEYSTFVRSLCSEMLSKVPAKRPTAGAILSRGPLQSIVQSFFEEARAKAREPQEVVKEPAHPELEPSKSRSVPEACSTQLLDQMLNESDSTEASQAQEPAVGIGGAMSLEDQCSELLAELGLDGEDPPDAAGSLTQAELDLLCGM